MEFRPGRPCCHKRLPASHPARSTQTLRYWAASYQPPPQAPNRSQLFPAARIGTAAAPSWSKGARHRALPGQGALAQWGARGSDRREHRTVACLGRAELRVPTLGRRHQRNWWRRRHVRPRAPGTPQGKPMAWSAASGGRGGALPGGDPGSTGGLCGHR